MDEILDRPLRQLAKAIRSGEMTSEQMTGGFLTRIKQVNPKLNAVVCLLEEQAMKHARNADIAVKQGKIAGPLHGVPVTIKDSLDTKDAITTWGTKGRTNVRPGADATCVARLREAGAIIMGKTNTPEFTLSFETDNLVYGRTNNPHDLNRTPGGSSGGAAAIIAANASPLDIGTDTGGSVRLPSHFCGIYGIKPTTGRIPCTGNALPISGLIAPLSQPGPMGRYVDDLIYTLPILSGPDLIDPHAVAVPLYDPKDVDIDSIRVGFHTDNGIKTPSQDIITTLEQAIGILSDHHISVNETRPTGVEMSRFIMARLLSADGGAEVEMLLEDCHTTEPSPTILSFLARNKDQQNISNRDFEQLISLWHNYQSSMLGFFNDYDILICPPNASTAIPHGKTINLDGYSYTSAYNLTGWPGVVIRGGTDTNGLPIGIQILARPFREDHCLAMAAWLEQQIGRFDPPKI